MSSYKLIKTGACSVVIGDKHFKDYFPIKKGKLLKISKINNNHNEFKNLGIIRQITEYNKYFAIPDEEIFTIRPEDKFYKHLVNITLFDAGLNIFQGNLLYFYIDDAGNIDLLDSIAELQQHYADNHWKSYKTILKFTRHILEGLSFLHEKRICHLDIKPENIVIDKKKKTYKIIDFGFCCLEPFTEFINDVKGTPGYFPKQLDFEKPTPWLPKIYANDIIPNKNGAVPFILNRKLIYKIDSYCFGRVLYFLKYIYDDYKVYWCFNFEASKGEQLDNIIASLTNNNVHVRLTISHCLNRYFLQN